MVFFHRFYTRRSFKDYKYEVSHDHFDASESCGEADTHKYIAAACVYLAGKVEESSRKLNSVVMACVANRYDRTNHSDEKQRVGKMISAVARNICPFLSFLIKWVPLSFSLVILIGIVM